jgi:putative transposase
MARPIRVEYAGAVYHVMARGNQGWDICVDDGDRKMWLATLAAACRRTGWRIHAWVLMGNHFHLLLELGIKAGGKELKASWERLRRGWL